MPVMAAKSKNKSGPHLDAARSRPLDLEDGLGHPRGADEGRVGGVEHNDGALEQQQCMVVTVRPPAKQPTQLMSHKSVLYKQPVKTPRCVIRHFHPAGSVLIGVKVPLLSTTPIATAGHVLDVQVQHQKTRTTRSPRVPST